MKKITTKYTYGYKDFIDDQEKQILLTFILANEKSLQKINHVKIQTIENIENYPSDLITRLREKIIIEEGIGKHYTDIIHEDTISWIEDGGFHDYHKDMNYGNWSIVRYNLILSKPEEGGFSIYGDEINDWDEKSVWKCVAGYVKHGVSEVKGKKPRISLSMGFMIQKDELIKKGTILNAPCLDKLP